jgi:hypothetical protein
MSIQECLTVIRIRLLISDSGSDIECDFVASAIRPGENSIRIELSARFIVVEDKIKILTFKEVAYLGKETCLN